MTDGPDIRVAGYSHQQLWDMVHAGPGPRGNADSEAAMGAVAESLAESLATFDNVLAGLAAEWHGAAADAATAAMTGLRSYGDLTLDRTRHAWEQRLGQAGISGFVRDSMPPPVPKPDLRPADGPEGVLTQIVQPHAQEMASVQAQARAREIMQRYVDDSGERVQRYEDLPPVPTLACHRVVDEAPPSTTRTSRPAPSESAAASTAAHTTASRRAAPPHRPRTSVGAQPEPLRPQPVEDTGAAAAIPGAHRTPATGQAIAPMVTAAGAATPGNTPPSPPVLVPTPSPIDGRAPEPHPDAARPVGRPGEPAPGGVPEASNTKAVKGGRAAAAQQRANTPFGVANGTPRDKEELSHRRRYGLKSDEFFDEADADANGALLSPAGDGSVVSPPVLGEERP